MRMKGVILDMDGLLIDSEPVYRRASQQAIREQGLDLADAHYDELIGLPGPSVMSRLATRFGTRLDPARYRRDFDRLWDELVGAGALSQKPGAAALVEALAELGIPYVLATSTYRSRMRQSLAATALERLIADAVCGDEVRRGKPHPDIVLNAAERLGLNAPECLVIEDSIAGVEAALAAAARAIMVPDLASPREDFAARGVTICRDLLEVREQVFRHVAGPAGRPRVTTGKENTP